MAQARIRARLDLTYLLHGLVNLMKGKATLAFTVHWGARGLLGGAIHPPLLKEDAPPPEMGTQYPRAVSIQG